MLLRVERVKSISSTKSEVWDEYINPESIERVRDSGKRGDERCVEVLIGGEWLRCLGTVQQVGHAVNELLGIRYGEDDEQPPPPPGADSAE